MPEKDKLSIAEGDHRSLLNDQDFLESVFKNKPQDLFVFLKLKKLAIALHIVSKSSENEDFEVFKKLQSTSLSVILNVLYGGSKRQVSLGIIEMVTLLDIVSASGVISSMNCRVLKEEFFRLLGALDTMTDFGKNEEMLFSKDFFEISEVDFNTKRPLVDQYYGVRLPEEKQNVLYGLDSESGVEKTQKNVQYGNKIPGNGRLQKIISLVKKAKIPVSIKDIARSFDGMSEKTIQRDLVILVTQGVLKKEGDRRWSRYSVR
jgi:hypothetical protein